MTDKDIKNNFQLCIKWLKDNRNQIGLSPLYIGWGKRNMILYYNEEFDVYDHNVYIAGNGARDASYPIVTISSRSESYNRIDTFVYGFDSNYVKEWKESYRGKCRYTFDELSIRAMEIFLMDWKRIKAKVIERIEKMASIDSFEV